MSFCPKCGTLLNPRKNAEGKFVLVCKSCTETPEAVKDLAEDEAFYNKLKNLCRSGRAEKQLKTLSRSLSIPENRLHDTLKTLDDEGRLPYGYYDKIDRIYIRTNLNDEISDDVMIDMIKQSYGYEVFGAKGLSNYISLGRHTSVRKTLQTLHGLRKKGLLRGHKRGVNWLWRLPHAGEDSTTPFFPKKEPNTDDSSSTRSRQARRKSPKGPKYDSDFQELDEDESDTDTDESSEEEDEDIDYDEEEEQDDSKMVYFADPEDDDEE